MKKKYLLYRLLRCRHTEVLTWGRTWRDPHDSWRKVRCERWLHLGSEHR